MSDVKLGILITGEQFRDAVHIAIAPVSCSVSLRPGQHVGLIHESTTQIDPTATPIGIVDPFLTSPTLPGQKFWLLLYPQTIKSLRHEWTHPAFANDSSGVLSGSKQWLRDFAENAGISYSTLMEGAETWTSYGDYLCLGGLLEGHSVPDEFWTHYEAVTGKSVPEEQKQTFFTCSC